MSFVEKALNRLKQQDMAASPVGRLTGNFAEAQAQERRDTATAQRHELDLPASHGKTIALDRQRLRAEGFLAPEKYERQMADEYRRIKRPLLANAFGIGATRVDNGRLVAVTSAVAGEGKTHTCINLALSLSTERDRTVLLVDGDVPKPHISRLFGVADQPGLLDALSEHRMPLDSLLIRTDIPRLALLPAGRWTEHATELLSSDRMRILCEELGSRYPDRIILFDSSPLLAATESQAICAVVGQVVLVIAENSTARAHVRDAVALLDEQKPVNAVLNKSRRASLGSYYGGYGHGSYGDREREAADAAK